jgi:hypothetical protein
MNIMTSVKVPCGGLTLNQKEFIIALAVFITRIHFWMKSWQNDYSVLWEDQPLLMQYSHSFILMIKCSWFLLLLEASFQPFTGFSSWVSNIGVPQVQVLVQSIHFKENIT